MLIIKTPAVFHIAGKTYAITPGQAIIISPNTPYSYSNPNGEYMDDWLHFDTTNKDFPADRNLQTNTFFPLTDIALFSVYIRQLLWENSYTLPEYRHENLDSLVSILLNHLSIAFNQKDSETYYNPYLTALQKIRINMQSMLMEPLSADGCADELGISKSHFQHLYTKFFGVSFQRDCIQMKIDYAKDLLETTDLPVEQIAETCGYASEVHFYRQFKKFVELTPAAYRRRFRNRLF